MAEAGGRPERPAIEPFGDSAILATFGDRADPLLTARAGALARALDERGGSASGIGRPVPAHATVLVPFDPLAIGVDEAIALIVEIVDTARSAVEAAGSAVDPVVDDAPVEIAVRYGGADGPDLDEIAAARGLRPADVAELHAGARYRVLFLGFAPGFAYLGGLPASLATPRRASPRERIPAGSVAIAGEHTGVYPLAMPGGWNLIGRTDARLFDPGWSDPALLRPGSAVRFVPAR